jgi:hypothetical protein
MTAELQGRLSVFSAEQLVVAVPEIEAGCDRMHELFAALPSERLPGFNAVYAFRSNTFLELLQPRDPSDPRARFLARNGPGFYMICATLHQRNADEITGELERLGKNVVRSLAHKNVLKTWHIHPKDAGGLLVMLAARVELTDNAEFAGVHYWAYVDGNSRWAEEIHGLMVRTADPTEVASAWESIGFAGKSAAGNPVWNWHGAGGTALELYDHHAWPGEDVSGRRDYAILLRTRKSEQLTGRLERAGLHMAARVNGRWLSSVDPVLGVRFAVEAGTGGDGSSLSHEEQS